MEKINHNDLEFSVYIKKGVYRTIDIPSKTMEKYIPDLTGFFAELPDALTKESEYKLEEAEQNYSETIKNLKKKHVLQITVLNTILDAEKQS